MDVVIKRVNFVRTRGLNLTYHTDARQLNRGVVLKRFSEGLSEIKMFMEQGFS